MWSKCLMIMRKIFKNCEKNWILITIFLLEQQIKNIKKSFKKFLAVCIKKNIFMKEFELVIIAQVVKKTTQKHKQSKKMENYFANWVMNLFLKTNQVFF